jgi:hypothetical protein
MTAAFSFKTGHPLEWLCHSTNTGSIKASKISIADGCSSAANSHMSKAACVNLRSHSNTITTSSFGSILSATLRFRVHPHFPRTGRQDRGLALFGGRIGFDRLIRPCIRGGHLRRDQMEKCNIRVAKPLREKAKTKDPCLAILCMFKPFNRCFA